MIPAYRIADRQTLCHRSLSDFQRQSQGQRQGFTLVELMACLVIIGLLTAVAAISLGGVRRTQAMADVLDQLRLIDERTRAHAERFGRAQALLFDLEEGRVERHGTDGEAATAEDDFAWILPAGFVFKGIRVQGEDWSVRQVSVLYAAAGISPTYAIHLVRPESGVDAWLMVTGASGRVDRYDSREQVDAVFDAI